ncbi:hypothetical protein FKW77_009611 [Venturia effusa]|uniref:DUF1014 domain protein n=1 Tax=Venturia effusa TaxID=50376 RepID=A0A517LBP1_9PEZI|nr:hypothetical protein FKW77_009611 [Venturia effusa]
MAGKKKEAGEGSKKAQGQARKAAAEEEKKSAKNKQAEQAEAEEWGKGAKDNSKKDAAAAKAAEAERKRAEKKALEEAELATLPSKPKVSKRPSKPPPGPKKGLNLDQLDGEPTNTKGAALNATGIDNALDALDLTSNSQDSVDRHPERRFKAAYTAYEEKRLEEMKDEKGLRRNQKIAEIRKEFEKHPDNPFNQVSGRYDMTKEELREVAAAEKKKTEARLAGSTV